MAFLSVAFVLYFFLLYMMYVYFDIYLIRFEEILKCCGSFLVKKTYWLSLFS
ncbi:uncharacterized protein DS421_19g657390 [Arachis hypogaea]|uniref:Uncharacterized protein n=1 Tax=Arachis hypogaea TaxID=3818 RepID=A0A6B9VCH1_ARAHY|nr:uncharacterized protein DS421_19g657390 [Arachis hypogaea]